MVLWFVGTAIATVWFVFRDESFDHRLLVVGVLMPDLVDVGTGGTWIMHSVVTASVLLLTVMVATRGRRVLRKSLLALPIGVFLHLVYDGAFSLVKSFWWPLSGPNSDGRWFGWSGVADEALPVVDRGMYNLVLEVAGAAILWWCWRHFGMADADSRRTFVREGRLRRRGGATTTR